MATDIQGGLSRRWSGIFLALVLLTVTLSLPEPAGLSSQGKHMASIFLVALALWATEAVPIAVTGLLVIILQPLLGVMALREAFTSFMSPVFFFVLAMFCLSQAFIESGLHSRFYLWLLRLGGTDSRRVILAFMVGTALVSMIMSDVPACAIFMAAALGIFAKEGIRPGSLFGRGMMIGIPIAALIGGVGTPAGSSINILGIHFIQEYGGIRVPFLNWMAIGIPMVLFLVPLAWVILIWWFPPEFKVIGASQEVEPDNLGRRPLGAAEIKVLSILSTMLFLWIVSTWVPSIDVVLVALAGAIALFLPGIDVLTWKQAESGTGWEALLIVGAVTSLGAASVESGLAKWLVEGSLSGIESWGLFSLVAFVSLFTVLMHLIVPVAPVINAVLIPPISLLALDSGQNPALYGLPVAFTASCAFLLPLDAVCLLTYSKGYYRMFDMLLPGSLISLAWVLLISAIVLLLGPVLGLI